MGNRATHIVIALPCPKHRCAVILPLAVDQPAQGIVVVQVLGFLSVLLGGDGIQLAVSGVGIGQGQAVGIGDGLGTAQVVVFEGDRVAVAPAGIREFPSGACSYSFKKQYPRIVDTIALG